MPDIFLKLDGIKGESGDKKHQDEIQIDSVSWGASNPTSFEKGSGGGVQKGHLQDVTFTATMDFSTLNCFQECMNGKHIKSAEVACRKAGGKQEQYLTIKLSECIISSIHFTAHDDLPNVGFSISYAKVESEYKTQKPDGTLDKQSTFSWDLTTTEKV